MPTIGNVPFADGPDGPDELRLRGEVASFEPERRRGEERILRFMRGASSTTRRSSAPALQEVVGAVG
jgi:hypothetical protein